MKKITGHRPAGDDFEENASLEELREEFGVESVEDLIREKRVTFAAHAARGGDPLLTEQLDREIKEKTRWGKMLKDDLNYYEFLSLGSLADIPAKYVRRGMRQKGASYNESEDPEREAYTPEEEIWAQAAREAEEALEEIQLNNMVWIFLGTRLREAENLLGYRFKIEKWEPDDFYGQIFMVNGKWYAQGGEDAQCDPPKPIFKRVFCGGA